MKYVILAVLMLFLVYPIAYIVPGAISDRGDPYRVYLVQPGPAPEQVATVLLNEAKLGVTDAFRAAAHPPALVAHGRTLPEALELARAIRGAGGTARLEGALRPTLFYMRQVFANPYLGECLLASLTVATASTLLTTVLTLPLAIWLTRFRFSGRGLLSTLLLVPLVLPPFVGAIGFRQIFSRFGSVNLCLMNAGIIDSPIDWLGGSGLWGLVAMEVLHLYPIMYLNVAAALANIDPGLEEAARNLGSSEWMLFRRVTFPLVLPGYFAGAAIVFVWAFTDLGTPLIFGYRKIIAYQIFDKLSEAESNPMGYALVLMTLLVTGGLYGLARWFTGRGQYVSLSKGGTGQAVRPAGRLRTLVILGYGSALTLLAILPHVAVVLTALAARWSFTPLPTEWTGQYFALAVTHKLAALSIRNSLVYSLASTVLDVMLGVGIAYLVSRRPSPLSHTLDTLAMLPLALPGLVLAFGYATCYQRPAEWLSEKAQAWERVGVERAMARPPGPAQIAADPSAAVPQPETETRWWLAAPVRAAGRLLAWLAANLQPQKSPLVLLVIAYAIRRVPYMSRAALAGFQQTSPVYEEAAANLGATRWRAFRSIVLPLIAANLVAGSILTFSFAVLEVSDSIMLAQRENYFPITKAIYVLFGRPDDGPSIASAMGVLGMGLLATALAVAALVLGRRMGEMFRA